jgi:hypothetical protein
MLAPGIGRSDASVLTPWHDHSCVRLLACVRYLMQQYSDVFYIFLSKIKDLCISNFFFQIFYVDARKQARPILFISGVISLVVFKFKFFL